MSKLSNENFIMNKDKKNFVYEVLFGLIGRVFSILSLLYCAQLYGASLQTDLVLFGLVLVNSGSAFLNVLSHNWVFPEVLSLKNKNLVEELFSYHVSCFFGMVFITALVALAFNAVFDSAMIYLDFFKAEELITLPRLPLLLSLTLFSIVLTEYLSCVFKGLGNYQVPTFTFVVGNAVAFIYIATKGETVGPLTIAIVQMLAWTIQLTVLITYYLRLLRRQKFTKYKLSFNKIANILPLLLGQVAAVMVILLPSVFAVKLSDGDVTLINYTKRIFDLLPSMLILPMVTALAPYMSRLLGNNARLLKRDQMLTGLMYSVVIPITVFIILNSVEIIEQIFHNGDLSTQEINTAASLLAFYFIGSLVLATNAVTTRFLILNQSSKFLYINLMFSLSSMILFPVVSYFCYRAFGIVGIAIGNSAYLWLLWFQCIYIWKSYLGKFSISDEISAILKISIISLIIGICVRAIASILALNTLYFVIFSMVLFGVIYLSVNLFFYTRFIKYFRFITS